MQKTLLLGVLTAWNHLSTTRVVCVACLYPATSTIVSVLFIFIYLLSLWNIFDSLARAVLNRSLKHRLRSLQGILTVTLILGVALRGVIIVVGPGDLGFTLIRLAYFSTVLVYVEAVCWTLVWWPILDARRADWRSDVYYSQVEDQAGQQQGSSGSVASREGSAELNNGPTYHSPHTSALR